MDTFVTICGWLVIVCICIAGTALALMGAADLCRRAFERFETAVCTNACTQLGRDLRSCAHWFSESPEADMAIRVLGDRIANGYGVDAPRWREEWREKLRSKKGKLSSEEKS